MDDRRQRWLWNVAIPLLLLLVALIPRLVVIGPLTNPDELGWLNRSVRFYDAMDRHDWAQTLQAFHPGVVPMWGFGAFMSIRFGLDQLQSWLTAGALPMADLARAAALFPVTVSVLTVLAVYTLVRRLAGREAGLYAALLLALDPYYLLFTHFVHMDLTHASLLLVAALLWVNYLYPPRRWPLLVGSGIVSGMALLTRSASLYLLPFSLLAAGVFFLAENLVGRPPRLRAGWGRWIGRNAAAWLIWLGVLVLTVYALWPALWVDPTAVLGTLREGVTRSMENAHPAPMYFLGEIINDDPGVLYYLVILFFQLQPLVLVLGLANPALLILSWRRLVPPKRAAWLVGLAYPVFYFVQMSFARHKLGRYMLPVAIALAILAGLTLSVTSRWLTAKVVRKGTSSWPGAARILILSAAIVLLALPWLKLAPYYSAYFSPLAGGAQRAAELLTVDSGLGLSEAADYLNQKAGAGNWMVPSFYHYVFQFYFRGQTQRPTDESWAGLPVTAEYAVLTQGQIQRDIYPTTLDFFLPRQPEHTIHINGIDYVSIYRVPHRTLAAPPPIQVPLEANFEGRVQLLGYDVGRTEDGLIVTLYWRPRARTSNELQVTLQLLDEDGHMILEHQDPPWSGDAAVFAWPDGLAVHDQHRLPLPGEVPPGEHHLAISLGQIYRDGQERLLPLVDSEATQLVLGPVELSPPPRPALAVVDGNLGGVVRLAGADPGLPTEVAAGATLPLTLTWESLGQAPADYTVFIHLASADGKPLAQVDSLPLSGAYPTSFWDRGEWLVDPYQLAIPSGTPPGEYELLAGMYLPATGERLPLLDWQGQVQGDSVKLGRVVVTRR